MLSVDSEVLSLSQKLDRNLIRAGKLSINIHENPSIEKWVLAAVTFLHELLPFYEFNGNLEYRPRFLPFLSYIFMYNVHIIMQ